MPPVQPLPSFLDDQTDESLTQSIAQSLTQPLTALPSDALFQRFEQAHKMIESLPHPPSEPSLIYRHPATATIQSRAIGQRLTVGRLPREQDSERGSDLSFPVPQADKLSRQHFEVVNDANRFIVRPLSQAIFMNGASTASPQHHLRASDIIHAGGLDFIFTHGAPAAKGD